MDHTIPSLDAGFGREALLSLTCRLETTPVLRISFAWRTSFSVSRLYRLELPVSGIIAWQIGSGKYFSLFL
jgi:hypothetical protein